MYLRQRKLDFIPPTAVYYLSTHYTALLGRLLSPSFYPSILSLISSYHHTLSLPFSSLSSLSYQVFKSVRRTHGPTDITIPSVVNR